MIAEDINSNIIKNIAAAAVKTLYDETYKEAAAIIGCDVASIKAVEEVESAGDGYLQDGRLKILFEGHQFWANLVRRHYDVHKLSQNSTFANILYPHWDRTKYKGGAAEWGRLLLASTIDKTAAYESASFGGFQIMGFNAKICQFTNVFEMVEFMKVSRYNQLICFLRYVKATGLADELRSHNWAKFAAGYNGPGYRGNPFTVNDDYDVKLAKAYLKFS